MYPAKLTPHQDCIRRAAEKFPLLKKGTILEGRYELLQDAPAKGTAMARDNTTKKNVAITVFADVLLWDMVQDVLKKIESGEMVTRLPSYSIKRLPKRVVQYRIE